MIVRNLKNVETINIKEIEYQGKKYEVKKGSIKWLVHSDLGGPEYKHNYAIRYFTIGPGGIVPMHSHDYVQSAFILSGEILITTDSEEVKVRMGDLAYIPSYQPHEFKNMSETDEATFTCTIDCPRGKEGCSASPSSGSQKG